MSLHSISTICAASSAIRLRSFSASSALALAANRAIVYTENGNAASVLCAISYPSLAPPSAQTVNLKFLLSPINPADINVIEGVYPNRPSPVTTFASSGIGSADQPAFVAGNEGLAEITAVGSGVKGLQNGDWVIVLRQQVGTWASGTNVGVHEVLKLPRAQGGPSFTEV